MHEYLPILIVGGIIGVFTLIFFVAYCVVKKQKEDMTDRERHMSDKEIVGRLLNYARPYWKSFVAVFCIMLFSLLSLVCLLNAFPRRKKANIPMVVIMFIMFAIIIYCDVHYTNAIMAALTRAESPIVLNETTAYIAEAYNMLNIHVVLIGITAALVVLLPVYSKLLRKINTSVDVEDNGDMGEIELND